MELILSEMRCPWRYQQRTFLAVNSLVNGGNRFQRTHGVGRDKSTMSTSCALLLHMNYSKDLDRSGRRRAVTFEETLLL